MKSSQTRTNRAYACERCFKDKQLREWIRENGVLGTCSWCRAQKVHRVSLVSLGALFREVAAIYSPCDWGGGDSISWLLQDDWDIFGEKIASGDLMDTMAISILEAGLHPKDDVDYPDYRGFFRRDEPSLENEWHERVTEILSGNTTSGAQAAQTAPGEVEDVDWFPDRIEFAVEDMAKTYPPNRILYRARIHKDRLRTTRFSIEELGAPPPHLTPPGRVNRAGEPVFYLASDVKTALAEVRAWKGAVVAIAPMQILKPLSIFDLTTIPHIESPFFNEHLDWTLEVITLFHRFAEELSRPVMPGEEVTHYIPSQHVCDVVRAAHYDGIAYPSAMGPGHNVVLFDPMAAVATQVDHLRVMAVNHQFAELEEYDSLYDDWPY